MVKLASLVTVSVAQVQALPVISLKWFGRKVHSLVSVWPLQRARPVSFARTSLVDTDRLVTSLENTKIMFLKENLAKTPAPS